ncbi:ankyrin repeat domain-containing protein [Lacunimicrobium album]
MTTGKPDFFYIFDMPTLDERIEAVKYLLIDFPKKHPRRPWLQELVYNTIHFRDAGLLAFLLRNGATANDPVRNYISPLGEAIEYFDRCPACFYLIIGGGADLEAQVMEGSPLHIAARYMQLEPLRLLLALGANPNSRMDDGGETPLYYAEIRNWHPGISILEAAGGISKSPQIVWNDNDLHDGRP